MNDSVTTLSYAVRIPVIGKYIGQLLLVLSFITLVPIAASLMFGDHVMAIRYLYVVIGLLGISIPLSRISAPTHIQTNEALVIVALAFMVSPVIMTYPLMASGLSFETAAFEAVSAITTTGLTTVTDVQSYPASFLFSRAWMQWYGGLGIVVLSIALLMGHHLAAKQLAEPLSNETMATTARTHARRMLTIYCTITLLGFVVLWIIMGNGYSALLHTFTAVSTGGFAPDDASLAALGSSPARYWIMFLALCGAVPLPIYYLAWRKHVGEFFHDLEFRGLLFLVVIVCFFLCAFLYFRSGLDLRDSLNHGILLGISAQTTTGFSTLDMVELDDSTKIVTIIAMLIGGGAGSSTGGIKILRLLILLRLMHLLIQRTSLPGHAVVKPRLGERALEHDEIQLALLLILIFAVVVLVSWLIFVSYGYPPLDALFEVVSATGTVGLSTGITHADLAVELKTLLCIDMLLGRVEIVALLIVLYPRTWFGKRTQYP